MSRLWTARLELRLLDEDDVALVEDVYGETTDEFGAILEYTNDALPRGGPPR